MLRRRSGGFTLVEIVIVLAIAGLIMVIVFLAVSGAEKNRRDTERKQDLGRLAAAVETYAANNQGNYPTANANPTTGFKGGFANNYLPSNFNDPLDGSPYSLNLGFGSNCNSPGRIDYGVPGASGPFRLRMCLEQGEYDIGN